MVTWLAGCAPPPRVKEGKDFWLNLLCLSGSLVTPPPGLEGSGYMAVLGFGPFMPPPPPRKGKVRKLAGCSGLVSLQTV